MKSVKGRKEGKDEEIKREAIRPVKMGKKEVKSQGGEDVKPPEKKEKSQQVRLRTGAVLKNCVSESK